ncbi:MAG: acyl-CoA thioesterase [Acidobacteria bacterium]|nr:acyl-CoA thioesterase [Acidobacteriota bacterium]
MVHETRIRVRYAETDQMGVAYHSNFLIWFEVGRVELMRAIGFNYKDMEQREGCYIAVAEARCRYKMPARYDEELIVRTWVRNVRASLVHFAYEVLNTAGNALLAEGETIHIVTDSGMQRRSMPEPYLAALEKSRSE